jgi:hypothetical protein
MEWEFWPTGHNAWVLAIPFVIVGLAVILIVVAL